MSNLIDRLNSLTEREKSNMSNVAGSFRKIFDSWPIDDDIEHPLQDGINYLLVGMIYDAQKQRGKARLKAIGNDLYPHLANIVKSVPCLEVYKK